MRRSSHWMYAALVVIAASCGRGSHHTEEAAAPVKPEVTIHGTELRTAINLEPDFLYARPSDNGPATGGVTSARVRLSPNSDRLFDVAIIEDCINCAGKLWQATVRTAAALSAAAVGRSLFDYEFKIAVRGRVDGPSAGALLAASFMAVLLGDDPALIHARLKKVGMTGGLNPDGTIAPVGLIHQKLLAAASAGKEVFCYPYGQSSAYDPNSKRLMDVEDSATRQHMKVEVMGDIYDAYSCLMGKPFPSTAAVDPKQMDHHFAGMRVVAQRWLDGATQADQDARKYPLVAFLADAAKGAVASYERADAHLQQSPTIPLGYLEAQIAGTQFEVVRLVTRLWGVCADPKLPPVRRDALILELLVRELDVKKAWDGFYQELVAGQPRSVEDAVSLVQAHTWAALSKVSIQRGDAALSQFVNKQRRLTDLCQAKTLVGLLETLSNLADARIYLEAGRDVFRVTETRNQSLQIDVNKLEALAQQYWSLADANWELYKELVPKKKDDLFVQQMLGLIEYAYARRQEKTVHAKLASLGATLQANLDLSRMITADYTLQSDADGRPAGSSEVLHSMMERAEEKAREAAHVAKVLTSTVPLPARFHYLQAQQGRDSIEGGTEPKLRVLQAYWTSAAMSELTRQLVQLEAAAPTAPVGK